MRAPTVVAFLATLAGVTAQATGKLGDAKVVTNSPKGANYLALFYTGGITGVVNTTSADKGVSFALKLDGFETEAGPYKYHIHVNPVPFDGNCTGTGGHLDPYQRTDTPACDSIKPETCEVGDLSGKWGTIATESVDKSFSDPYVSLLPGDLVFFGNRSIVFHNAAGARVACANLTTVEVMAPTPAGDACDA